jgi:VIT1/CCC1 family predicted Fe2+/Mn2+ transporter
MKSRVTTAPREPTADQRYHLHGDPHHRASALSDVILGGQDGLVNVLGVILGVAAATADAHIVIVAGLAATFAESISMGAVAYTSTMAEADIYASERAREYRHIRRMPELERQEVRQLGHAERL